MLELVAKHRPERRLGHAGELAPDREPVRGSGERSRAVGADGAEHLDRVGVHPARRLQVGDRRRARRPGSVDDPDDEGARLERCVPAGAEEKCAKVARIDDHARESRN